MTRQHWDDLPTELRAEIETQLGGTVLHAREPESGRMSDVLATVETADERAFVKGIPLGDARERMLRNEILASPYLPATAPRLWWSVERAGWLVAGYEHIDGRHADLAPNSTDLDAVAATLRATSAMPALGAIRSKPFVRPWRSTAAWQALVATPGALTGWEEDNASLLVEQELRAFAYLEGDRVVHSDLHKLNILVDGPSARFVDWGWVACGPGWVDPTLLVIRLIAAGHTCVDAERWAAQFPAWADATPASITAFSVAVLGMWRLRDHFPKLVGSARRYVDHRLAL